MTIDLFSAHTNISELIKKENPIVCEEELKANISKYFKMLALPTENWRGTLLEDINIVSDFIRCVSINKINDKYFHLLI